jgi:hypothetical protein
MSDFYIDALRGKLTVLKEAKNKNLSDIQNLLSEIEKIQKSVDNIIELLHIEGVQMDTQELKEFAQDSISELAYHFLNEASEQTPKHYMDIYKGILNSGKPLPGKNPSANLLTHMSRDDRFIRVSPGTYGLKEWGIQPQKNQRKKQVRNTNKKMGIK